ncbi:MAG TPA: hypothetical protein VFT99_21070, partial [Roseiflexaceae bacterium]|nr:hypothetical protein [Roseiflexaceae bacterium]
VKGRATAYSRSGDAYRQDMPFTNVYGNGGLLTTVRDLVVWWDALYTDKLGSGLLAQLTTSGVLNNKHTISYALGVSNGSYRGLKEIAHSGATAGYRAYLVSLPESKTTVAVLCNNGNANSVMHAERVLDVVMAGQLAPAPAERVAVKAASNIDLTGYAGVYRNLETEETHRLEVRDGKLVSGPIELIPTGANLFQEPRRNVEVQALHANGTIQLRLPGTEAPHIVLTKVTEAKPDATRLQEYAGSYTSPELGVVYQVVVADGNLVVKRRMQPDLTLAPSFVDGFSNFGTWQFTRDAAGKVNGLLYSQGRIRRVRFVRSN